VPPADLDGARQWTVKEQTGILEILRRQNDPDWLEVAMQMQRDIDDVKWLVGDIKWASRKVAWEKGLPAPPWAEAADFRS
jgi:hypothetical protein